VEYVRNTDLLISLGKRIRALRLARKLTQNELGFICNNHGELNVTICSLYVISEGVKLKDILDF